MAKGQVIVMSLLAILGIGAIGGGLFLGTYVDSQLEDGIKDALVIKPDLATDPKQADDYADWLTNADEDDVPKYKKYYLWNLTNPDEYLGGAEPVMEEIGPYAYRQYDIKIGVSITDTQVTYNTFTYYRFDAAESFPGADKDNDVIVNVNPQYIGVLQNALFGGSEAAFITAFVGPAIEQIMDGLNTDFVFSVQVQGGADAAEQVRDGLINDFSAGVIVQKMPEVLEEVQAGVTENLHLAINGSGAAGLVAANIGVVETATNTLTALDDFFNSTTFSTDWGATIGGAGYLPLNGVSEFAIVSPGYTATAVNTLLNTGVPAIGVPNGWLSDLDTGTGVLYFMGAYQVAANVSDTALDLATMAALYNMTTTQLGALANYVLNHLFEDKVQVAVTATYGAGTAATANVAFYMQWANTSFTDPLDLDSDTVADGFEVGAPGNITLSEAMMMWDETSPLAFTNESGIITWFGAALGDTAAQVALGTAYPRIFANTTILTGLFTWLSTFKDGFVTEQILDVLSAYGITTVKDIGYFHWGNGALTGGVSIQDLDPEQDFPVEFWNITGTTLDLATVHLLLRDGLTLVNDSGLGAVYTYGADVLTNNVSLATINGALGTSLSAAQAAALYAYVDSFLIDSLVLGNLKLLTGEVGLTWADLGYFHWANGAVTGQISIQDLVEDQSFAVEFWNVTGFALDLSDAKALLAGAVNLTDSTMVGYTLLIASSVVTEAGNSQNTTLVAFNTLFGSNLNLTEFLGLVTYLQYLMQTVVIGATLGPIFAAGGGLITSRTPEEWLFNYEDPLLAFLRDNLDPSIDPAGNFFSNPPLSQMNNVDPDEADTFKTGGDDIDNVWQYVKWNGMTQIDGVWVAPEVISGTDATQFHPGVKNDETLKAFVSDLLRVVDLVYQEDIETEGIDLLRFTLSSDTLATNANYFQTVSGLANMTASLGAPLFLSKPHFLDADATLTSSLVTGMAPVTEDHDTFIDVEPITGAVMSARKRLQLNFQVGPNDLINTGVSSAYVPIMWVEEGGDITPDLADSFKETVYGAQRLQQVSQIGGPAVGAILLLSALVMGVRMRKP